MQTFIFHAKKMLGILCLHILRIQYIIESSYFVCLVVIYRFLSPNHKIYDIF